MRDLDNILDLCHLDGVTHIEHIVQEAKDEEAFAVRAGEDGIRRAEELARRGVVDVAREVPALPRIDKAGLEGMDRLAVVQLMVPAGDGCGGGGV